MLPGPRQRHKAKALRHVGRISIDVLRIVEIVDNPEMLSPEVIRLLAAQRTAEDFVATVRWLKDQNLGGTVLDRSIRAAATRRSLGRALQHGIERIEHLWCLAIVGCPRSEVFHLRV